MEKTGRKCSQLDCDLRPYEQLCAVQIRLQNEIKLKHARGAVADYRSLKPGEAHAEELAYAVQLHGCD